MYIPMEAIVGCLCLLIGFVIGLIVNPQSCTRINQSQNFDIGVCQLSRPRPRRISPYGVGRRLTQELGGAGPISSGGPRSAEACSQWEHKENAQEALGHALVLDKVIALVQPLRAYTGRFRAIPERLTGWMGMVYLFVSLRYTHWLACATFTRSRVPQVIP